MTGKRAALGVGIAVALLYLWRQRAPVASVTTSEGFDLSSYGGEVIYPQAIKNFAESVARAEGFFLAGSIPQRAHNPGDLKIPGWTGATLGAGICVFSNDAAGWNALYKQLYLILTGSSDVYDLDMTIADMARKWTATQPDAWAGNVASFLAVDVSAPLWSVLA